MDTSKEMVSPNHQLLCFRLEFNIKVKGVPNTSFVFFTCQVAMANFLTEHLQMFLPLYESLKRKGYAIKRAAKHKAIKFLHGNAESTSLPDKSFDLVTVMWAFHEAPSTGRDKILKEARRLLSPGGVLAVIDISADYEPSKTMLQGEPYVQEYQQNINRQLQSIGGFKKPQFRSIVDNHLSMWTLTRSASMA